MLKVKWKKWKDATCRHANATVLSKSGHQKQQVRGGKQAAPEVLFQKFLRHQLFNIIALKAIMYFDSKFWPKWCHESWTCSFYPAFLFIFRSWAKSRNGQISSLQPISKIRVRQPFNPPPSCLRAPSCCRPMMIDSHHRLRWWELDWLSIQKGAVILASEPEIHSIFQANQPGK